MTRPIAQALPTRAHMHETPQKTNELTLVRYTLRSLLSILMGFSTACQSKEQSEVAEEVNSVAAWTSNLIFQVPCALHY